MSKSNSQLFCSRCGLPGHVLKTSRMCLFYESNREADPDHEMDDPHNAPKCASCGGTGHSRRTHKLCPNNPNNRRDEDDDVEMN